MHGKAIDDGKEKSQTIKFYDFTKDGKDIVDQLNDYYQIKVLRCVMVVLSYMLDPARVNGKTV